MQGQETHSALYRKYRPKAFADVRGQDSVVEALQGALKKGKIPHALLFSGPRGTGKTSIARIFAREIGASDIDIYEIDAASNRGIDDVRALREAVLTLPYESSYKVYIIDEVHMLTKEAFNALLKTLEEPPTHVVFILATTEVEKLLPTIVSRCQVYRFRQPSRAMLRDVVASVAKQEGYAIDEVAADLVAIAADGSFRDALGITQKIITASSDKKIDGDEAARIVGAPRSALLMDVVLGIHEKDPARALHALQEANDASIDMRLFLTLLLERMRVVMLLRNAPEDGKAVLEQYPPDDQEVLRALGKDAKSPINSKTLLRFLDAHELVGRTAVPSLPLELAVIDAIS